MRTTWIYVILLLGCVSVKTTAQQTKQNKPNIIVVLADDIGVGDISVYRSMHTKDVKLQTPNIDKLAASGMVFTNAHAPAALCATSRYAILTGNYNYRSPLPWGVWSAYSKSVFTPETLTLGRVMKQANYQTAFIGKWHLGTSFYKKSEPTKIYEEQKNGKEQDVDISKIADGGPSQNGFDYNFTLPAGIQSIPYAVYENDKMYPLKPNSKIGFIDAAYMEKLGHELEKKKVMEILIGIQV
jgi:arylsulfatase A-like enzyme